MAVTTDLSSAPDGAPDTMVERPGQWLIDQLHALRRAADDRRLAQLLAAHPLPVPRAGV